MASFTALPESPDPTQPVSPGLEPISFLSQESNDTCVDSLVDRFSDPNVALAELSVEDREAILSRAPHENDEISFATKQSNQPSRQELIDFYHSDKQHMKFVALKPRQTGANPRIIKWSKLTGSVDRTKPANEDLPCLTMRQSHSGNTYPRIIDIYRSQQTEPPKKKLKTINRSNGSSGGNSNSSSNSSNSNSSSNSSNSCSQGATNSSFGNSSNNSGGSIGGGGGNSFNHNNIQNHIVGGGGGGNSSNSSSQGATKTDVLNPQHYGNQNFHGNVIVEGDLNVNGAFHAPGIDLAEYLNASKVEGELPKFADIVKIKRKGTSSVVTLDTSGEGTLACVSKKGQAGFVGGVESKEKLLIAIVGQIKVNIDVDSLENISEDSALSIRPSGNNDGKAWIIEGTSRSSFGTVLNIYKEDEQVEVLIAPYPTSSDIPQRDIVELFQETKRMLQSCYKMNESDGVNVPKMIKKWLRGGGSKTAFIQVVKRAKEISETKENKKSAVGLLFKLAKCKEEEWQIQSYLGATEHQPLRSYQQEVIAKALKSKTENGIVVLETGTGKTRIAMEIIKGKLVEQPDKYAVLLAPTRILVLEHVAKLRHSFGKLFKIVNGNLPLDYFAGEGKEHGTVFVMTPAKWQARSCKEPSIENDVSIIVLDECHDAVSRHGESKSPYSLLMEQYVSTCPSVQFVGLTATPDSALKLLEAFNSKDQWWRPTGENLIELERIVKEQKSRIEPEVVQRRELDRNYEKELCRLLEILGVKDYEAGPNITSKVQRYASAGRTKLKDCKLLGESSCFQIDLEKELQQCVGLESLEQRTRQSKVLVKLCGALSYGLRVCIETGFEASQYRLSSPRLGLFGLLRLCLEEGYVAQSRSRSILADPLCQQLLLLIQKPISAINNVQHPKYTKLKSSLMEQLEHACNGEESKSLQVMIFVQYRESANILKDIIENDSTLKEHFFPLVCVGKGNGARSLETMTDDEQQQAVFRFKNKKDKCNMIIATSVLYEGIDIQACNVVVMYSSVPRGVAWIQASGRARQANSVTKILYYGQGDVEEQLVLKAQNEAEEIFKWIRDIGPVVEEKESNGETKMDDDDWEIVGEENFNNSKSQVQKLDDVDVVQENMAQAFQEDEDGEGAEYSSECNTEYSSEWNPNINYVNKLQEKIQKENYRKTLPDYNLDDWPTSCYIEFDGKKSTFDIAESNLGFTKKKQSKRYLAFLFLEQHGDKEQHGNESTMTSSNNASDGNPSIDDDARMANIRARLSALKKLREAGLITEELYIERMKEIIGEI